MAITVNISEEARVGKPSFLTRNQFLGKVIFGVQASGPARRPPFPEKRDRRPPPVINDDVKQAIFVEIPQQAPHRRCGGGIVAQRPERKRFITLSGSRRWLDRD